MSDIIDDFGLRLLRAWEDVQKTANRASPHCEATSSSGDKGKLMGSALMRSYSPSAAGEPQQQAMIRRQASGEQQQDHEEPVPLLSPALPPPPRRAMNLSSKLLGVGAKPNGQSLMAEVSSPSTSSSSPRRKVLPVSKGPPVVPPLSLPPPAAAMRPAVAVGCRLVTPCGTDSVLAAAAGSSDGSEGSRCWCALEKARSCHTSTSASCPVRPGGRNINRTDIACRNPFIGVP